MKKIGLVLGIVGMLLCSSMGVNASKQITLDGDTTSSESKVKMITLESPINTDQYELTVNTVGYVRKLASAENENAPVYVVNSGSIFISIECLLQNKSGSDLFLKDMFKPIVVYNGGAYYTGTLLVDGKEGLKPGTDEEAKIGAGKTVNLYGLVECPKNIKDEKAIALVVMKLCDGISYQYNISGFYSLSSILEGLGEDADLNTAEIVMAVQDALNESGYECGTADGIMGSNTSNAISKFQTDNELEVTGTITRELIEELSY